MQSLELISQSHSISRNTSLPESLISSTRKEGIQHAKRLIHFRESLGGENSLPLRDVLVRTAGMLSKDLQLTSSVAMMERALKITELLVGLDSMETAIILRQIGLVLELIPADLRARPYFLRALRIAEKHQHTQLTQDTYDRYDRANNIVDDQLRSKFPLSVDELINRLVKLHIRLGIPVPQVW